MPIRPAPMTLHCSKCRWSKTVAPRSDVLMPGEWLEVCPSCQGALEARQPSTLEKAMLKLRGSFRRGRG